MRRETNADKTHTRLVFDSFSEYLDHNTAAQDHMSDKMYARWNGADSIQELIGIARKGMAREGIEALELVDSNITDMHREIISQQFQTVWQVDGADVDVSRYLDGEPECMMNYHLNDRVNDQRVVTLVLAINVPGGVSKNAITEHGRALVALVEAIQGAGLQTEIWADSTVGGGNRRITGRQSIRLKAPGDVFDIGTFMFALTHPGMLRGFIMNTMHEYPASFRKTLGIPGSYGGNRAEYVKRHASDYPEGAILIPGIMSDSDAGKALKETLAQLGLLTD